MRSAIAAVMFVACHQTAPPPPLTARAAHADLHHVAIQPCPLDLTGTIEHEMFPACAPVPFVEAISVCPRGECPKPCRVEVVDHTCGPTPPCTETQTIVYDARGRFVKTQGTDTTELPPQTCSYDGDRLARCEVSTLVEIVGRDTDGQIATVSDGETIEQLIPHYSWSGGTIASWDAGREGSTLEFDDAHRVIAREDRDGEQTQRALYGYNAAGDVSEIDGRFTKTTIDYDARQRPIAIITLSIEDGAVMEHRELAWDDEDRLVRDTMLAADGSIDRVYTYNYACR